VNDLANFFSLFTIRVLGNLLLVLGILIVMFLEDWRVGTGLAVYSVLVLFVLSRTWKISLPHMAALRETSAQLSGFWEERLAGTEDISANGGWGYVLWRMFQLLCEQMHRGRKANVTGALVMGTANFLFALCNAIGLALGAYLYWREAVTIGTVYLIFQYTSLLFDPLHQITLQVDDLQKASASIQRIQTLFQIQSSMREQSISNRVDTGTIRQLSVPSRPVSSELRPTTESTDRHTWLSGDPSVQFDHVSFAYVASKPILHDLSFQVQPGQVLGIIGRTGSGKTSIGRLLLRLYDPSTGTIRFNGIDISQVDLATLRQNIGLVTQEVQLFHASVRNNLTFYAPHIADKQIVSTLNELGLSAWYRALPAGLDTRLDPGKISAGEAQLLAFARIFLRNPGLVILDEASSRLDSMTEQRLEIAIDKLLEGRTGIIIAHRLSTVQRVDHIMVLNNGRLLEYGKRQSLATDPKSYFSQLLQTGLNLLDETEDLVS
jgi:ABC-type multidrug transport system fused ATPase/permease subunit